MGNGGFYSYMLSLYCHQLYLKSCLMLRCSFRRSAEGAKRGIECNSWMGMIFSNSMMIYQAEIECTHQTPSTPLTAVSRMKWFHFRFVIGLRFVGNSGGEENGMLGIFIELDHCLGLGWALGCAGSWRIGRSSNEWAAGISTAHLKTRGKRSRGIIGPVSFECKQNAMQIDLLYVSSSNSFGEEAFGQSSIILQSL